MLFSSTRISGAGSGTGGGIVIGNAVTGGVPNDVLYVDAGGNLGQDPNFTWDTSTLTINGGGSFSGQVSSHSLLLTDPSLGTNIYLESSNGAGAGLSGPATGRIRYNDSLARFEKSVQGGAYTAFAGGTISGTASANQVAYGTAPNTIGHNANFAYTVGTGQLLVAFGGNDLFTVDPSTDKYALGGYTGGGIGNALVIDNGVLPGGNYIKWQGSSHDIVKWDGANTFYTIGWTGNVAPGVTANYQLGNFTAPTYPAFYGTFETVSDVATGDVAFVGSGNLSVFGFSNHSVAIGHISGVGDTAVQIADMVGGVPTFTTQTFLFGAAGITQVQNNISFIISGGVNNTMFTLNDATQNLIGQTANFTIQNPVGNRFIFAANGTAKLQLGDIDASITGANVLFDAGAPMKVTNQGFTWDMGATNIQNLLDPVLAQDAATKAYADSLALGLSWKTAVKAVTTVALPAYTYLANVITEVGNGALPAIDGVTLINGDRVLIKDEVGGNLPYNGIYDVTDVGSAGTPFILTRSADNNTGSLMVSATVSSAPAGVVNGASAFTQSTPAVITIGVSNIVWVNFLNTVYLAGAGLTLTSHTFSIDTAHANTWSALQTFDSSMFRLAGATSGFVNLNADATSISYTLTTPHDPPGASTVRVYTAAGTSSFLPYNTGNQIAIQFDDNAGNPLGSSGTVNEFEITGPGVTSAVRVGNKVTITVSGGGGNSQYEAVALKASQMFLSGN